MKEYREIQALIKEKQSIQERISEKTRVIERLIDASFKDRFSIIRRADCLIRPLTYHTLWLHLPAPMKDSDYRCFDFLGWHIVYYLDGCESKEPTNEELKEWFRDLNIEGRMTLDEAITRCRIENCECKNEHLQLAEWLEELRDLRIKLQKYGG